MGLLKYVPQDTTGTSRGHAKYRGMGGAAEMNEDILLEDRYLPNHEIYIPGYEDQPLKECDCGCWTSAEDDICEYCRESQLTER